MYGFLFEKIAVFMWYLGRAQPHDPTCWGSIAWACEAGHLVASPMTRMTRFDMRTGHGEPWWRPNSSFSTAGSFRVDQQPLVFTGTVTSKVTSRVPQGGSQIFKTPNGFVDTEKCWNQVPNIQMILILLYMGVSENEVDTYKMAIEYGNWLAKPSNFRAPEFFHTANVGVKELRCFRDQVGTQKTSTRAWHPVGADMFCEFYRDPRGTAFQSDGALKDVFFCFDIVDIWTRCNMTCLDLAWWP